jgi:hypothetical protein
VVKLNEDVIQVTVELLPGATSGNADAITSSGDIAIALAETMENPDSPVKITTAPVITKVSECKDGISRCR